MQKGSPGDKREKALAMIPDWGSGVCLRVDVAEVLAIVSN